MCKVSVMVCLQASFFYSLMIWNCYDVEHLKKMWPLGEGGVVGLVWGSALRKRPDWICLKRNYTWHFEYAFSD